MFKVELHNTNKYYTATHWDMFNVIEQASVIILIQFLYSNPTNAAIYPSMHRKLVYNL